MTRAPLVFLAIVLVAVALVFRDTLDSMIALWDTENFRHAYIIVPISLWLIWRKREELGSLPIRPFWPAAACLAVVCAAWLVGDLAGVNVLKHFALVAMMPCLVALMLGWRILWCIAFPVAFLFFAVPFGEFLFLPMMDYTASFTVAALRLSGIPVMREGLFFTLPTGRWSVVEACSGLRYLLAALPLACIYAYLSFTSIRTRLLFIASTAAIAIVANWVRAYLIVMLGHLSGMTIAVGVDHLIYGWVFFGIVMGLAFWVGSFWQDTPETLDMVKHPASAGVPVASLLTLTTAAAAGVILAGATPALAARMLDQGERRFDIEVMKPALTPVPLPATDDVITYRPFFYGGIAYLHGRSVVDGQVGILVRQYLHQHRTGEMISYRNSVGRREEDEARAWSIATRKVLPQTQGGRDQPVNEYVVMGPGGRFLVWEWFRVNGRPLTDARQIKLYTALDLLRGRGDESLAMFVWTPLAESVNTARPRLERAASSLQSYQAESPR